ncbi:hypothetical protein WOLCODRAFT_136864 [Wolfiporia cocos MD-104 SS10]|uniref:DUF6533 domain-containing protein n=1 Tax=Wolfiporia cocos (strain MD-104) TaxID=742152 RepID=A0A2H3JNP6_WOLCO|nr:hypothetical protein WOLCODRAFT_136864 [Wolfiporia cocos MD-104 SS10]
MSSSSGSTPNATGFVVNACSLVSSVLIFYDHLLTMSREVDYIWRAKMTMSTIVFYGSRYAALTYGVFGISQIFSWNNYASCVAMNLIPQILMMVLLLMWTTFSAIRAYAISGHNPYATVCVGLLALVSLSCIMYIVANLRFSRAPSSTGSCSTFFSFTQHLMNKVSTAARVCLIASETTVLIILIICTPDTDITKASFAASMRRNGLVYFAVMVLLNILDAVLFVKGVFYNVFPSFISPLSSIIISRFVLDLREEFDQSSDETLLPSMQFMTNLHAPDSTVETDPYLSASGGQSSSTYEMKDITY